MGGILKGTSSLEGVFSAHSEKPIKDILVVTHNKICMLSLNHLDLKREAL